MQSWSNSGQNGASEGSNSWQSNYAFAGQTDPYDPNQSWSQPGNEQANAFSHLNSQDNSGANFFDSPHQGGSFLPGGLHNTPSTQPGYHGASISLNQPFSQAGQDVMDTAFGNIHADLYHQSKMNLTANGMGQMGQVHNHPHAHSQAFAQHDFSFQPQNDQPFESAIPYAQQQMLSQAPRQENRTPVQPQFDGIHGRFNQGTQFSRPPQQSPLQYTQNYVQSPNFPSTVNATADQFSINTQGNNPRQTQGQSYMPQPGYAAPQKTPTYTQAPQNKQVLQVTTQTLAQSPSLAPSHQNAPPRPAISHSTPSPQPPITTSNGINSTHAPSQQAKEVDAAINTPPPPVESSSKTRARSSKAVAATVAASMPVQAPAPVHIPEPIPAEPVAPSNDLLGDAGKKVEEVDALAVPVPTDEEQKALQQFAKRSKTAQLRYPSIKGLPCLLYEGSIKLPAPKSYDKLTPLVAMPARSGHRMIPELGYELPCEIQGVFNTQYRPSPDKCGLDERRIEAKVLLDNYDRSMKSLGKRRPKYTEYPHAFKEQLKSDEASKNKAEKKAKKEQEEERVKPMRTASRPSDPIEAAVWDVIGFVHIEPSIARTNALIAGRVQQAGDLLIKLRGDMNRAKLEVDQGVKEKLSDAELEDLKVAAEEKKEILYRALDATIEHADDGVLDNLGGHQKLVLSLVNALITSIKANDFSGKLPKALLELFTHFRMTKKIAETPNFETVRKRLEDKGDSEVKELARLIATKIKKFTKSADSDTATGYTGTSAASRAKAGIKGASEGSSTKRGRDDDSDVRTVKKIAVESTGGSLSRKLAQPKISSTVTKTPVPKVPSSSLLPGKSRPVPKPVSKAEPIHPDSPSGSNDEKVKSEAKSGNIKLESSKVAPLPSKTESKASSTKAPSASSASSGIMSLLDSINAPKADPASTIKDTKGSETPEAPEDRAKRLRKEARRKLRVTWKPEAELVQVKIFHKHDEEDEGREMNLIRDAADDRSEGMVLKQRAVVDEDEDDDDIPYQPWLGPVATDFSNLPDEVRAKNFVTRGGQVTFATQEQHQIAEREQKELMAIYTVLEDIPPTPKSPPPELAVADVKAQVGYLPSDQAIFEEIQHRWRDEKQVGIDEAFRAAARRLDAKKSPSNRLDSILGRLQGAASSAAPASAPTPRHQHSQIFNDIPLIAGVASAEQVLNWLKSDKVKSWRDSSPSPGDSVRIYNYTDRTVQMMGNAVEQVVRGLIGKPYPAQSPPEWISTDEERVREWWLAFHKETVARQKRGEEEQARAEAAATAVALQAPIASQQGKMPQDWMAFYAQQPEYAPYMALLQQMTGAPPQAAQQPQQPPQQLQMPDSQLQSILAAINQPSPQATQAAAANATSFLNPNDPSYQQIVMLTQLTQGQQPQAPSQQQQSSHYDSGGSWDRNESSQSARDQYNNNKDAKEGRKKKGTLPPHKPANKALIGTKPCTFWQQGKCARGDKCTFRHD